LVRRTTLNPKAVRAARRAFWLAAHWKIALVLAVLLVPLLLVSHSRCSNTSDGCSLFELVTGAIRIVSGGFT
jgi:lipopolysaccharide export LptBFGC system permease protein LptF